MIIAKSILLRSPALQRTMCAMGLHWWMERYRYGLNLAKGYGWHRVHWSLIHTGDWFCGMEICYPLDRRCRFCGKEE